MKLNFTSRVEPQTQNYKDYLIQSHCTRKFSSRASGPGSGRGSAVVRAGAVRAGHAGWTTRWGMAVRFFSVFESYLI